MPFALKRNSKSINHNNSTNHPHHPVAYQVSFQQNASGSETETKCTIQWCFRYPNNTALADNSSLLFQHVVVMELFDSSGKCHIIMDEVEIHSTVVSRNKRFSSSNPRRKILEHTWGSDGKHKLKVIARAGPPKHGSSQHFYQYDFLIDGQSFFTLPKVPSPLASATSTHKADMSTSSLLLFSPTKPPTTSTPPRPHHNSSRNTSPPLTPTELNSLSSEEKFGTPREEIKVELFEEFDNNKVAAHWIEQEFAYFQNNESAGESLEPFFQDDFTKILMQSEEVYNNNRDNNLSQKQPTTEQGMLAHGFDFETREDREDKNQAVVTPDTSISKQQTKTEPGQGRLVYGEFEVDENHQAAVITPNTDPSKKTETTMEQGKGRLINDGDFEREEDMEYKNNQAATMKLTDEKTKSDLENNTNNNNFTGEEANILQGKQITVEQDMFSREQDKEEEETGQPLIHEIKSGEGKGDHDESDDDYSIYSQASGIRIANTMDGMDDFVSEESGPAIFEYDHLPAIAEMAARETKQQETEATTVITEDDDSFSISSDDSGKTCADDDDDDWDPIVLIQAMVRGYLGRRRAWDKRKEEKPAVVSIQKKKSQRKKSVSFDTMQTIYRFGNICVQIECVKTLPDSPTQKRKQKINTYRGANHEHNNNNNLSYDPYLDKTLVTLQRLVGPIPRCDSSRLSSLVKARKIRKLVIKEQNRHIQRNGASNPCELANFYKKLVDDYFLEFDNLLGLIIN